MLKKVDDKLNVALFNIIPDTLFLIQRLNDILQDKCNNELDIEDFSPKYKPLFFAGIGLNIEKLGYSKEVFAIVKSIGNAELVYFVVMLLLKMTFIKSVVSKIQEFETLLNPRGQGEMQAEPNNT